MGPAPTARASVVCLTGAGATRRLAWRPAPNSPSLFPRPHRGRGRSVVGPRQPHPADTGPGRKCFTRAGCRGRRKVILPLKMKCWVENEMLGGGGTWGLYPPVLSPRRQGKDDRSLCWRGRRRGTRRRWRRGRVGVGRVDTGPPPTEARASLVCFTAAGSRRGGSGPALHIAVVVAKCRPSHRPSPPSTQRRPSLRAGRPGHAPGPAKQ